MFVSAFYMFGISNTFIITIDGGHRLVEQFKLKN